MDEKGGREQKELLDTEIVYERNGLKELKEWALIAVQKSLIIMPLFELFKAEMACQQPTRFDYDPLSTQ